jgi:hypothetical protein
MLIGFMLLNVGLYLLPSFRSSRAVDTPLKEYGLDRLLKAYPGWASQDVLQLHEESRVVFEYQPFLQFKIKPMTGKYVNVTPHGFRLNGHPAVWPPNREAFNVFIFGGSTAFGWLLSDRDTIPAQLEKFTAGVPCPRTIAVYNFAHPSYFSTQEALLFQSLISTGIIPNLAIFIDGFNEFFFRGEPAFTDDLRQYMDRTGLRYSLGAFGELPIYTLARRLRLAILGAPLTPDPKILEPTFERIIAQWIRNKQYIEAMAARYGTEPVFVWQPVPTYKYDLKYHFLYAEETRAPGERFPYDDIGFAYALMNGHRNRITGTRFLWLADIQEQKQENLYIDRVHYTAAFSREIARRIFAFLESERLLCRN